MPDKNLVCKHCGDPFVFSEKDQDYYKRKGLTDEPRGCKPCRVERRIARGAASRPKYAHFCAQCGKIVKVIFPVIPGRLVFCLVHLDE
jgi:hypothetical protein